jgi:hypothetical protein
MSNSIYFLRECPTCGRQLQIRVEYLGKMVMCRHCQGQFTALDPTCTRCDCAEANSTLLRRVDELLDRVAHRKEQSRGQHPR